MTRRVPILGLHIRLRAGGCSVELSGGNLILRGASHVRYATLTSIKRHMHGWPDLDEVPILEELVRRVLRCLDLVEPPLRIPSGQVKGPG